MEDKNIYLVIEEFLGTDGKFGANAFPCRSHQEAGEFCTSQIVSMCEQQGIDLLLLMPPWQRFEDEQYELMARIAKENDLKWGGQVGKIDPVRLSSH